MAKFRVKLLQQVQILQSEYLGRIQQEQIKEMKWYHFYEDLNPEYWWMLAHKVDDKHPARYSNLLLAAWKLERHEEARDPLLPKTIPTGEANVTYSQTLGNLFPSQKLKASCDFTAQSAMVEGNGAAEDSGTKAEEEEEAKSLGGENPVTSSRAVGADQSVGYIVHFANAVKMYQRKNWNCFRCGSPDHLMKDCPKDLSKTAQKVSLNAKEWMTKKGGQTLQTPVVT